MTGVSRVAVAGVFFQSRAVLVSVGEGGPVSVPSAYEQEELVPFPVGELSPYVLDACD